MFDNLSQKLNDSIRKITKQNKITEANIEESLKEIRLHLLEADVNFKVVKNFIDRVKQKALGSEVLKGVSPGTQFVKIVQEELVVTLGTEKVDINLRENPSIIFLVGLQGAGKTTTAAKLALYARQKFGKRPGLIPADVYRPAAIEQLQTLGKQNSVPVFNSQSTDKPVNIVKAGLQWAKEQMLDVVIVDTAGRLQIDETLMGELTDLKALAKPHEILLVADAMLGQQSVNVATGFHEKLGLTGLILTKVDGDARGGAALSIREMTGIPIKFLGVGEKVGNLEVFHPDRLASRILDMGDVLTLFERAQDVMDQKVAEDSMKKVMKNQFTLDDFLGQMQMLKKMGGIESLLKMLPGAGAIQKQMAGMAPPEKEMKKIEAIIRSMTAQEKNNLKVLNGSRRERIAKGSGTQVQDVNKLVRDFENAQKQMSQMMKMGFGGMANKMKGSFPRF